MGKLFATLPSQHAVNALDHWLAGHIVDGCDEAYVVGPISYVEFVGGSEELAQDRAHFLILVDAA